MIGSELETFKTIPEPQQVRIAKFANEVGDINNEAFNNSKKLKFPVTAESAAAKKLCLSLLNKSVESSVAKLKQAKRFRDLDLASHEFVDWSAKSA